jgi:hypothetical protein
VLLLGQGADETTSRASSGTRAEASASASQGVTPGVGTLLVGTSRQAELPGGARVSEHECPRTGRNIENHAP